MRNASNPVTTAVVAAGARFLRAVPEPAATS